MPKPRSGLRDLCSGHPWREPHGTIEWMPAYAYAILAAGSLLWFSPFLSIKRNTEAPEKLNRRARWGVILEALGYTLLWQNQFWARPVEAWRIAFSVVFFACAGLLAWTGARALGPQWRIDAALIPNHQLVRSGVYGVVRHPIYASFLCFFLGTGFMIAPLPVFLLSTVLFVIGTEIRVRIEDALLVSRFGNQFRDYQRTVPAYVPFLKYLRPANVRAKT